MYYIYQANPGEKHWVAVKNVLKYLRGAKDTFLVYGEGELEVTGSRMLVSGVIIVITNTSQDIFCLNNGVVSWKSSKLDVVAIAEYIVEAAITSVWIRKFLIGLEVVPSVAEPSLL
jgi:hypothetical protein